MKVRRKNLRREEILACALRLAHATVYTHITREELALACDCAPATISLHLGTIQQMRREIISAAIAQRDLVVIAQGIVANEPKAKGAPDEIKRAALESML